MRIFQAKSIPQGSAIVKRTTAGIDAKQDYDKHDFAIKNHWSENQVVR